MSKKKKNNKIVPKDFKEQAVASFKNYGLTIPTSDAEVELFEKIYGTTDFEMPEDLKDPNSILEWGARRYEASTNFSDEIIAMAAHDGTNISSKTLEKMKLIHKTALKKTKKKK